MPLKDINKRREYDLNKYREQRQEIVNRLGGKCVDCNSIEKLEFDHNDPSTKVIDIYHVIRRKEWLEKELPKIVLRCKTCHKRKTVLEENARANVKHGLGRTAYNRCGPPKCDKCKKWNRLSRGGYKLPR